MTQEQSFIQKRLKEHWDELQTLGYEVVFLACCGSPNYKLFLQTDNYKSDIDTKAVILPSIEYIASNNKYISFTHLLPNGEHLDVKDVREMWHNFEKQNLNFLEILFTDYMIINPKYQKQVDRLLKIREQIAHLDPIKFAMSCMGMSKTKLRDVARETPSNSTEFKKYGYSPKNLSQILRLNDTLQKFLANKPFKQCMEVSDPEYLKEVKQGKYSADEAIKLADQKDTQISAWCRNSYDSLKAFKPNNLILTEFNKIKLDLFRQYFTDALSKEAGVDE